MKTKNKMTPKSLCLGLQEAAPFGSKMTTYTVSLLCRTDLSVTRRSMFNFQTAPLHVCFTDESKGLPVINLPRVRQRRSALWGWTAALGPRLPLASVLLPVSCRPPVPFLGLFSAVRPLLRLLFQ